MNKELMDKVNRLERLANKIQGRKWVYEIDNENLKNENSERFGFVLPKYGYYIAAVNPATILELIEELKRLDKEVEWFAEQKACKQIQNGCCCGHDKEYWREAARKAVENT